jgi:hypothetical protein
MISRNVIRKRIMKKRATTIGLMAVCLLLMAPAAMALTIADYD